MTDINEGDNSLKAAVADLQSFADRIARLEEEKSELNKDINEQIRDIYAYAKARGYDVKALKTVLALRKQDEETRAAIHLYGSRMGVFA
jgi:uncharacterized protein (UPF0335 family)